MCDGFDNQYIHHAKPTHTSGMPPVFRFTSKGEQVEGEEEEERNAGLHCMLLVSRAEQRRVIDRELPMVYPFVGRQ